jgi:hypothetical protein
MSGRRRPHEVLAAWIVTGPIGHLYAGIADGAGLLVRLVRARGRWDRL